MAINFTDGNILVPNTTYINETLAKLSTTPTLKQSLEILRSLNCEPATVASTGNIEMPAKSFIRLVTVDTSHSLYNNGVRVVVYFTMDEQLNNTFEFSTAYVEYLLIKELLKDYDPFGTANVEYLLIEELLKNYDPFKRLSGEIEASFKEEDTPIGLLEEKQAEHVIPGNRLVLRAGKPKSLIWDWGRIRFFLEQPPSERSPIPVTKLDGSYLILDGNHRICAAILRGDQFIPVIKLV